MNKMDLENQKVLVAGLGKSGMAAYELLKNMGAKVSLFDGKKGTLMILPGIFPGQTLWLFNYTE